MERGLTKPVGWRLALASAIGTSHTQSGFPCQDYGTFASVETRDEPVLALVACDGAGSASRSDVGAQLAAEEFIRLVRTYFDAGRRLSELTRAIAESWTREIATMLAGCADEERHDVREYACTLLGAILSPTAAAFVQIGDGAIVVSHGEEDGWSYVFWPQHGEFANTTNFIVSPNAVEALEFDLAPRCIEEVAVFTDGIENLVLHQATRTVHEPFFRQMFRPVRESQVEGLDTVLSEGLARYLSGPAICERTDDDKTLILATRLKKHASGIAAKEITGEPTSPVEKPPTCPM
jgi:hypothetical protein